MTMHPLERSRCQAKAGQIFRAGKARYRLRGKIGDGAVGLVRKAENLDTGVVGAVKFLAPDPKYIERSAFDEVAQRFRREGTRGRGLDHENLVEIVAYEDNNNGECFESANVNNPFIVMEYIEGRTLEDFIRKYESSEGPEDRVGEYSLFVAASIADALTYLHQRKLIHRDVKPSNVFLSADSLRYAPGSVKLGDFGVTKWGDFLAAVSTGSLTTSHQQGLGTLKYMSPEQSLKPKDVNVRSDIFSLGITLFELFTGRLLPSPHHVFEVMTARTSRGNTIGRLYSLGVNCVPENTMIFEMVLDMFLFGSKGRPASKRVHGTLRHFYDQYGQNE